MIQVTISCTFCNGQTGIQVVSAPKLQHWARRVWQTASGMGWTHDKIGSMVACPQCLHLISSPSRHCLPVSALPYVCVLQCDRCGRQMAGNKPNLDEGFTYVLRSTGHDLGWAYMSFDNNHSYVDLCPQCAIEATNDRRNTLIRMVWSKPTYLVAREIGISDKALEKQCRRWNISKPPRGFWAKWHEGYMLECRELIPSEIKVFLGDPFLDQIYPVRESAVSSVRRAR